MKIYATSSFFLTALLVFCGLSPIIRADDAKPATTAAEPVKSVVKLINVDFPGGTIAQFVDLMAKSDSGPFNVIGEKNDMEVVLPPFAVRNVDKAALGRTIGLLLTKRGLLFLPMSDNIYGLAKDENYHRFPVPDPRRSVFASFQLSSYLAVQSIDDIVSALRSGWELDPTHEPEALKLKFHPATSVLLVSGPNDAIVIAHEILAQLKQAPEKKTPPAPSGLPPPTENK